jgi:redox-sensitive bicupin YhaK (pirin superfamily)
MSRKIKEIIKTDTSGDISQYIHGDLAKKLAPFVLFDSVHAKTDSTWGFNWHPHSGVATLTYIYGAELHHQDTSSGKGVIKKGGMQWMQAGNGIWHKEFYAPINGKVDAHQLWVQLPPKVEDEPASYIDMEAKDVPIVDEKVKVITGSYKGVKANISLPVEVTYLDIELHTGEEIEIEIPKEQTRAIIFPRLGELEIEGRSLKDQEFAIFEENEGSIKIKALHDSLFILASTAPNIYPFVASRGQIHTNQSSLDNAKKNISNLKSKIN